MKQVTSEEFYKTICPLDVTLDVQGKYPFKTVFKLRWGKVIGYQDYNRQYYLFDEMA